MSTGVIGRTGNKLQEAAGKTQGFLDPIAQASLPVEQEIFDTSAIIDPQRAQLNADIFGQVAPQLGGIYDQILEQSRLSQAGTDAQIAAGSGRDAALALRDTVGQVDPEYMRNREIAGARLAELLGDLSVDASGGEMAEIERLNNRSNLNRGTDETGSNTEAIRNALQFGEVRARRRGEISNSLAQALSGLQQLRTGFAETSLNKPTQPNIGLNAFVGTQPRRAGDLTFDAVQPLIGGVNQAIQQKNAEKLTSGSGFQRALGDIQGVSNILNTNADTLGTIAGIGG